MVSDSKSICIGGMCSDVRGIMLDFPLKSSLKANHVTLPRN